MSGAPPQRRSAAQRRVRTRLRPWWAGIASIALTQLGGVDAQAADPPSIESIGDDASVMPRRKAPPIVRPPAPAPGGARRTLAASTGWSRTLVEPPRADRRRRVPQTQRPADFGSTLRAGERFKFDVKFAGNPAGLAEATIIGAQLDPRGPAPAGAPMIRIEGHARTSGIISLLATVTDDVVTLADAQTGATVSSVNTLHYAGWSPVNYKHRVTESIYEGRGYVRITDTKDAKAKTRVKHVPIDTFDPMAAMAWVRALELDEGQKAKAHVIDGTTLLRLEIQAKGRGRLEPMPSIGVALELGPEDVMELHGVLTRVDPYDQAIPGKRVYELSAWISADERRIPLAMESDMWVGSLRLELTGYDPPRDDRNRALPSSSEQDGAAPRPLPAKPAATASPGGSATPAQSRP